MSALAQRPAEPPATLRPAHCAGANLRLTLDELDEYERMGVVFVAGARASIRREGGRGQARVACSGEEMAKLANGVRCTYGVCAGCAGLEESHRARLRSLERPGRGER